MASDVFATAWEGLAWSGFEAGDRSRSWLWSSREYTVPWMLSEWKRERPMGPTIKTLRCSRPSTWSAAAAASAS